ncbi:cache domain-containing protein [Vibrio sp. SS-MA-C1-2]|uniref:cache domain-containing protein n=1 Tax=Vibrio sp. SS-MA-C1-2 TaxID=2908646 RepID=UPI001F3A13FD|nr:cache domain-containing protein [Vibrio sp. SS-MA-C1-2]UJF17193.1 cache domain-containing protein [Vibrio sp. SS-MA-C1-2]
MRAFLDVHFKLVVAVWFILFSVLSLLCLINFIKFDNLMSQVISSKLDVVVTSLNSSIKRVERLGMSLDSSQNLLTSMESALNRNPNIKSIIVTDSQGKIVLSSASLSNLNNADTNSVSIDSKVIKKSVTTQDETWLVTQGEQIIIGKTLFNNFSEKSGSIIIDYDKSSLFSLFSLVKYHLIQMTLAIFLAISLLAFLVIRISFNDITQVIRFIQTYTINRKNHHKMELNNSQSSYIAEKITHSEQMRIKAKTELKNIKHQISQTSK